MPVSTEEALAIVESRHGQPHKVLGLHTSSDAGAKHIWVRAFVPEAAKVWVVSHDGLQILGEGSRLHDVGLFETRLPNDSPHDYLLRVQTRKGAVFEQEDPYRFPSQLSDFDLHLMREGTHYRIWEKLGAHECTIEGVQGVLFVVWAPNASRVSVVGDFNQWDGRRHCMSMHGNGLWELFVPGIGAGASYKYEIRPRDGDIIFLKADPYAFYAEMPPKTASRVCDVEGFGWTDQKWMLTRRDTNQLERPISIYEVHLGSWMHVVEGRSLSYREAAERLAAYVQDMGFTHVELMPITEHPFYGSWGYQTVSFFAPTSRFGEPKDLMAFIDTMHQHGIGVILDWVPAHFPTDAHGLANFDGTHLYEHADPREGMQRDWNTMVFNYGRTEVRNFLLASALFWLEMYHFDGIRVDAVASMLYRDYSRKEGEWIPNKFGGRENLEAVEFVKQLNIMIHREYPGAVTIAEESTSWPGVSRPTYLGGLGFTFKWNMGWMHDVLGYFAQDPVFRKYHANELTFSLVYANAENFILALSHDEVVYGKGSLIRKMPGDEWQKFANARALLGYMMSHPGKKHLFQGMEFGQWNEWNHNTGLDWHLMERSPHAGLHHWVKDLHRVYRSEPALFERDYSPEGFRWIDCRDTDNSVYSFLRFASDASDFLVFVCNFTPVRREGYRIGVPRAGFYAEILNSDASIYGGGNLGNGGGLEAEAVPWQGHEHSLVLTVPPLAVTVFKPAKE